MQSPEKIFRLDGKVAFISGAARGLGAHVARTLAAAGASVFLTDVLSAEVEQTAKSIRDAGGKAAAMVHDVTQEAQWEAAMAQVVSQFGGLDVLVNNAGVEDMAFFAEGSLESFKRIQDINVNGTFLGLKHAIRVMRPDGASGRGGAIVNLSSLAAMIGVTGLGAYCASKGAVRSLTKSAAIECAQLGYGIRVNSIHPGVIKTAMGNHLLEGFVRLGMVPDVATAEGAMLQLHPLGLGTPDDVANAVLYLASPASRWTTGAEIVLDGGANAQ
ncbi:MULTISPECIES: SDR family NAD(P)-dependent oxidoreductase [Hydrocarboniphaga]|uniref:Putative dehydrogenase n=1 Tax=Hydrocarboniphaga effusa AP103 TaxID=1172194 RepID=I7ZG40_9GAMM|nr:MULTISPECIES: glucose 1-dehydrogenase [Hydrocarboniphaga]EIT70677.1 putative dehydrogenase [Hydrocarboniphaga effusa AP103]MDZ4081194.1 glucose 1-dehydrogenase [Hydrocarboniphaga sp.]